jgi:phosphate transport system protein
MRSEYRAWLDEIDDELVGGALVIAEAMPRICRAFLAGDGIAVGDARSVVSDVRERCRYVDDQAFLLLAREAPVSGDLRRLMSIVRLVADLDRAAALLRHVAEAVDRLDPRSLPEDVQVRLAEIAGRANDVFRRGVDAWRQRDGLAVHEVDRADAGVDSLATGLILRVRSLEGAANDAMVLGLLARYFERLADHGVAFAQHSAFAVTGTRVELPP